MIDWFTPTQVFDGETLGSGLSLGVENGRVTTVTPRRADARRLKGIVTPGFVDLQVNGGGGLLLNGAPERETVAIMAEAHRRFGTVAIMPTVITDADGVMARAADAVLAARDLPCVIGLHIEGPHISKVRRGTHAPRFVRPMDAQTWEVVTRLREAGLPVMLTLAPEVVPPDEIARLAAMGVVVSIGHTDATAEQVEAAIEAGAGCATHLFNAMSPMASRAPGVVGAILHGTIPFGMICDGYHVDDRMARLALRAAGEGRAFLVSDAMATIGGPDSFALYGTPVHLRDGRLINSEGNLAGAHMTQAEGLKRLVSVIGVTPEEALRMTVSTPARVMGAEALAQLIGRRVEDVLVLSEAFDVMGPLGDHVDQHAHHRDG